VNAAALDRYVAALGPLRLPYCPLEPTAKQEFFLRRSELEVFTGGSAGGGKTISLLAAAVQYCDIGGYSALMLRPTLTEFFIPGGLHELAQDWLGNSHLAIVSVGGLVIWQQLGFGVVVFTAALLALPPETAEAARIDGAGWWALQLRVLVPQIRPIIELLTVIQVITVLSWVFNYVYVLTSGGPGYASSVMELYIWRSFSQGANGTAASVAVMLFGMASVLIGLSLWVRRRAEAS